MHNLDLKNINKNLFVVVLAALSLFLVVLIISTAVGVNNKIKEGKYIGQEIESKNTITVSAMGEVYTKPDLALVAFSVVNEAKTVSKAMEENKEKMNAVISLVKDRGVEDKDLKTTDFNIYPRYEWYEQSKTPPYSQGRRVLVGYEVRQSLQVKIRDFEKIGDLIEGATSVGANQVGNLQFTIDKQDEIKKQAREQAIEKAKTKAKELASQLNISLVRITNFSESAQFPVPRYYGLEEAGNIGGGGESLQIEPGENKITVSVIITYEIN